MKMAGATPAYANTLSLPCRPLTEEDMEMTAAVAPGPSRLGMAGTERHVRLLLHFLLRFSGNLTLVREQHPETEKPNNQPSGNATSMDGDAKATITSCPNRRNIIRRAVMYMHASTI
jgi:hypothetical protein